MRTKTLLLAAAAAVTVLVATASASTGFSFTQSAIAVAPGTQFDPSTSGAYTTYTDDSTGNYDIHLYDSTTGTTSVIAGGTGDQQLSDVSGNHVVYTGMTTDHVTSDIFLYDIASGSTTQITSDPSDQTNPSVSDQVVAWEDFTLGTGNICYFVIATGATKCIAGSGAAQPSVSGSTIAYVDLAAGSSIVVYDASTGTSRTIYPGPAFGTDVDGAHVVFSANKTQPEGTDITVYDLGTGVTKALPLAGDQVNPRISGDWVSFEDLSSNVSHLGLWNYVTGELEFPNLGSSSQWLNDISGNRVVYTDDRNGNPDVYALDFLPPDSAGTLLDGLIGDVKTLALPYGTQTSLLAKLYDAEDALAAASTGAACTDLASFVSETSAQSGKKIAATDAARLIAEAQQIEASIPC